ncbi:10707_t:CDS:10 [Entrophospora sp. SA101]|nr:10122_t:CDS:10 [Entrophospora sp. SA101]CAJ0829053.1 11359_t:CDS:10 [Entrophospora sp. SA101]CAJ0829059.1 11361_t:CDS:10 [Entrophospora sp. SA101]CAJ0829254.1 10707_t:CDS:10 [Entrophospora sp. SA101]CAJ0845608.1 10283_t:CDS:10 [Entrophospora sp. SA101]
MFSKWHKSDAGYLTCAKRPGSLGYEYKDAQTFASWDVDYLKYDNCNNDGTPELQRYTVMRDALNATGRPIFFSICEWGRSKPYLWGPSVGNSWRTTGDIHPNWSSIISILKRNQAITKYSGPGGWNDPDMLQVGNGRLTIEEQKAHFSLWAALKAPLLLGFNVWLINPPKATLEIVKNQEIIAINQDPLGRSINIVEQSKNHNIWTGPLIDGYVVILLNLDNSSPITISVVFSKHIGKANSTFLIRDLWDHKDIGVFTNRYSAEVPSHGVKVLKLTKSQQEKEKINQIVFNNF